MQTTHTGQQNTYKQDTIHEMYIAAKTKHKQEKHYDTKYIILQHFELFLNYFHILNYFNKN
jgi:hypothetical protein